MTVSLKHLFQSSIPDDPDTSLVRPSDWNAEHTLTLDSGKLLGRSSAGTGAAEEITVGSGLSLSGGTLSNSQSTTLTVGTTATSGGAAGQIMFDTGSVLQESSNLVWNNTNGGLTVSSIANPAIPSLTINGASNYTGATLSGVQITGTAGQFSCNATTLVVGEFVTISGTFGGTGSITGYANPTTYRISATNGTTTFTLVNATTGAALTTTAGTPTGLTYTVTDPFINLSQTWNNSVVAFTGLRYNVTDTASNASSLLMDLQVGGTTKFSVAKNGQVLSGYTGTSVATYSFVGDPTTGFGYRTTSTVSIMSANTEAARINFTNGVDGLSRGIGVSNGGPIYLGAAGIPDTYITRRGAANLRFGAADAAAPVAQTLSVQSVVAGTSNTAGANLTITGSQGTGTGAGGNIIFQTSASGASGTAQNALSTVMTLSGGNQWIYFNNAEASLIVQKSSVAKFALYSSGSIQQVTAASDWAYGWSSTTTASGVNDTNLTRKAANNIQLGLADAAAPVAQTLSVQSVVAGTSNTAGANLTITGSQGTGTGAGGSIIFQTAAAGSSGTAQNALSTALTIASDRSVTFTNSVFGVPYFALQPSGYTNGIILYNTGTAPSMAIVSAGELIWGSNATNAGSGQDLYVGRRGAANLRLGRADAAAPVAQTLSVQSVVAGTTDTAGANLTITGSQSTGTGAAGNIIFQTSSSAASTGTAQNALATVATIGPNTLTGSQATSLLNLAQTWNTTGTPTALLMNITDTASNANSLLMDLQVGGSSRYGFRKNGVLQIFGPSNSFAGLYVSLTGDTFGRIGMGIYGGNNFPAIYFGPGGATNSDLFVTRKAANNIQLGLADAAAPVAQTLSVQSVVAGTSNTAGANLTITGSQGTGTGAGGSIIFQTAPAGTTGTAQNALANALTINSSGQLVFGTTTQQVQIVMANLSYSKIRTPNSPTFVFTDNSNDYFALDGNTSPGLVAIRSTWAYSWSSSSTSTGPSDTYLTRRAAANLRLGLADAAAPVAQTLSVQSVVAGTSNTAGANLTITGSQGTGTGAGGSIIFQYAPAGVSGTAQNALAAALTINGSNGNIEIATSNLWFGNGNVRFINSGSADGVFRITGTTGDFNRVQFGGTSSSFPALKRSTTILQVRLADDSAYAPVEASTVCTATAYTVATLPAAGTAGRRAYVTDATAPTWLGALTGGGAVVCPVFDNGTAWVAG